MKDLVVDDTKYLKSLEKLLKMSVDGEDVNTCFEMALLIQDWFCLQGVECTWLMQSIKDTIIRNYKEQIPEFRDYRIKSVYVIKFNNNTVKIGIAKDFVRRKRAIQSASGLMAEKWYATESTSKAREIESYLHKLFANQRLKGEFFDLDFDKAVAALKKQV